MTATPEQLVAPIPGLPVPRLELVYEELRPAEQGYTGRWVHRLVLQHLDGELSSLTLGVTRTDGGPELWPFRATPQIKWDMAHMGLPGFRVVGGKAEPIPPGDADWLARVRELNAEAKT